MPSFKLPSSLSPEPLPSPSPGGKPPSWSSPGAPLRDQSPSLQSPSPPSNPVKVLRAGRSALALLGRVHASFARAEAVHQARLDAYWAGPDRHLLTHYAWSAK